MADVPEFNPFYPMPLQFDLPIKLTTEKFIAQLSDKVALKQVSRQYTLKTYFDSFDWRLHGHGITCELNQSRSSSRLVLRHLKTGQIIANEELDSVPAFSRELKPGKIRSVLEPVLEMRALLSVCKLDYQCYRFNIINKNEETILRLFLEEHELYNNRVSLQPVAGHDHACAKISRFLTAKLKLLPSGQPLLLAALKLQGIKPKAYTSKLTIHLDPDMRADIAGKFIYSHLLKTIKDNEQGVIADTDSEFLHDFRIAVRKTRSGLSQIKGIQPESVCAYYAGFFSWLGQITSQPRDLDVYLLNFERYKDSLPATIRNDLDPLHELLQYKQQKAQKELAAKLKSKKYLSTLAEWEQYLKEPVAKKPPHPNARRPIKELADLRLRKIYHRILQKGEIITDQSPAQALHELRKTCKKLRYLMEFFQSLYPEDRIKPLIKSLKALQKVLGEFQDCEVQADALKLFREEMLTASVPANTALAMDLLIEHLNVRQRQARHDFSEQFTAFRHSENRAAFKSLFDAKY
jgi:CHAD domain-containing protein